ncbi:unnamed protein product [Plutella xylostella]|uniref:(diamondback moth) hypothetical protein n=1 Tax=Plutella xylostella TaxID=51655 RepID=A0A8S4FTX0_PLUXY|nr:unnamed protein product [Plutella xylostella]
MPLEPREFYQNQTLKGFSDSDDETTEKKYDFKSIEEKYRFRNNEEVKRFKVATDGSEDTTPGSRRIVGGLETSVSVCPYIVAISKHGRHWCGGSIIDEQWVLTAAHCMQAVFEEDRRIMTPYTVRAGSSYHSRGGYQARINKVFFPHQYNPDGADYDFCLLRLDRPLPIGRSIAVLDLPARDYALEVDDILVVSGWGSTDKTGNGHVPDRVRFVPVPLLSTSKCQRAYKFPITPRMICAGYAGGGKDACNIRLSRSTADKSECQRAYKFPITPRMICAEYSKGGKDACNHDSGGPAVRDNILLGVVSFGGRRCGDPNSPGVYSRVSALTPWIEKTIRNNEAGDDPTLLPKIKEARKREREIKK